MIFRYFQKKIITLLTGLVNPSSHKKMYIPEQSKMQDEHIYINFQVY